MIKTTNHIILLVIGILLLIVGNLGTADVYTEVRNAAEFDSASSMTGGIQEAIDSLSESGGKVYVPAGTYTLKACVRLKKNVMLVGDGPATILREVNETRSEIVGDVEAGQEQIVVKDASGFEIGMEVSLIGSRSVTHNLLLGHKITAIDGNAITLSPPLRQLKASYFEWLTKIQWVSNSFPMIIASTNCVIADMTIDGNKDNIPWCNFWHSAVRLDSNSGIKNCRVLNSHSDGVWVTGTDNKVIDNTIYNSISHGIHLNGGASYAIVIGNHVYNNGASAVSFCAGACYCTISNNVLKRNNTHGINGLGSGGDKYNIIISNIITENKRHGISCDGEGDNTITNNIVMNNSKESPGKYSGIWMACTNTTVSNNRCLDNQKQRTQKYGIEEVGSSDYNIITGNLLIGNLEGNGLFTVGRNDVISNNITEASTAAGSLAIDSIIPNSSPAIGSTEVIITGQGFVGGVIVAIGDEMATDITVLSETQIKAKTPPSDVLGAKDVVVTAPDGASATLKAGFTYNSQYPFYDVNQDGVVDILDLVLVGTHFGEDFQQQTPQSPLVGRLRSHHAEGDLWLYANAKHYPNQLLQIEIKISSITDLYGYQFDLAFNPEFLELVTITPNPMFQTDGAQRYWNVSERDAIISVIYARQATKQGIHFDGTLATVVFKVKNTRMSGIVYLANAKLADSKTQWIPINIKSTNLCLHKLFIPVQATLLPNYPNPINPDTWIPYQLARTEKVQIAIFSLQGKLIRILDLGEKPAGFYLSRDKAAYWDGRSSSGEKVSSGVYFLHLACGSFTATRKMIVIK